MITSHAPYQQIIATMFAEISDLQQVCKELEARKEDIRKLRKSFNRNNPEADYSQKHVCDAYMLLYYPFYIETVYRLLNTISTAESTVLEDLFGGKSKLTVSFLGTGPSPELLGTVGYLSKHHPKVVSLDAFLVDLNTASWQEYRTKFTIPMSEKYGDIAINRQDITCDLLACEQCLASQCAEFLGASDLVIMQNCITDLVTARNNAGNVAGFSFLDLFLKLRPGTLFLVIDLDYSGTREAINEAVAAVQSSEAGSLLCQSQYYEEYSPKIDRPECLKSLFDGSDGLIMRTNTRYHYAVLKRTAADSVNASTEPVDWVKALINQVIGDYGFSVASAQEMKYRRRYKIAEKDARALRNSVDVVFDGKNKISQVQLQGEILSAELLVPLNKALIGKNLADHNDHQTPLSEQAFEHPTLQAGHDLLIKELSACNLQVTELRRFPYMVRYKVDTPERESVVFDRYYNGRFQYTKTIFHSKTDTLPELWDPFIKLLNGRGEWNG